MDEAGFADLVALCQFLPGPASSQVAFALGLIRGRSILGGLTASLAFTTPSALILFILALGIGLSHGPLVDAVLHGLALVAVAVVAQAVWGMAKTLTPDRQRVAIALVAVAITVLLGGGFGQILAIVLGACLGLLLCDRATARSPSDLKVAVSTPRRHHGLCDFCSAFMRAANWLLAFRLATLTAVCRLLSFRRTGLRRWSCGFAAVADGGCGTRLGDKRYVPHRLWSRPSRAGAALYLRHLSRRGDDPIAARCPKARRLRQSRSSCQVCCSSMACCRSGPRFACGRGPKLP